MVVDRVSGIFIHLQRRQWTRATSDVEDRLVDAWLSRLGRREAITQEVVNVWIPAIESSSQNRRRYREMISSHFSTDISSEGGD